MEPTDLVTQHGIDPTRPAPAPPARAQTSPASRRRRPHLSTVRGEQAATARAVVFPGAGPRWVDLCWDHGMAARRRSRLPATLDGIGEDLRAAAREAGLAPRPSLERWCDVWPSRYA
ncbi:hypothetical protein AB0L67_39285 [Streptomyces flaveolus]|uniref:hypothetical protein n=1 Tax=Streptomyces flaveolus TaxID=67297 RepID=UPI0034247BFA